MAQQAPVTVKAGVRSLALCSGLKDLMLLKPRLRLQLWPVFSPWPGNFHILQMQPFKKKSTERNFRSVKILLFFIYFI